MGSELNAGEIEKASAKMAAEIIIILHGRFTTEMSNTVEQEAIPVRGGNVRHMAKVN